MSNPPSDRTIVLNLLRGAVPERAEEISKLWLDHGHAVEVAPNAQRSTMNATSKRIKFDTKTIDFFWLIGFSAWRAIEVYAPALTLAVVNGGTIEAALNIDEERGQFEQDYRQRIASAQLLLDAADTSDIAWPDDVPMPTDKRQSLSNGQDMAVFDLVALSLAFALLHEFKHVQCSRTRSHGANLRGGASRSRRRGNGLRYLGARIHDERDRPLSLGERP